jgi:hypothetical protein
VDSTGTEHALLAALAAPTRQPERKILHLLRQDGLLTPALLAFATLLAAGAYPNPGPNLRRCHEHRFCDLDCHELY